MHRFAFSISIRDITTMMPRASERRFLVKLTGERERGGHKNALEDAPLIYLSHRSASALISHFLFAKFLYDMA